MSEHGPGQTLFEFVRHWSRRTTESGTTQGRLVVVVEAVHTLTRLRTPATINAVARELGIDQSGASRWITDAVERGYVTLHISENDGRSRHATLTPVGHEILVHAHAWQEHMFVELTEGWNTKRRREFQQAMSDILDRSHQLNL